MAIGDLWWAVLIFLNVLDWSHSVAGKSFWLFVSRDVRFGSAILEVRHFQGGHSGDPLFWGPPFWGKSPDQASFTASLHALINYAHTLDTAFVPVPVTYMPIEHTQTNIPTVHVYASHDCGEENVIPGMAGHYWDVNCFYKKSIIECKKIDLFDYQISDTMVSSANDCQHW